jgi:anti-sigma regulatory factor (Ser/Thr protein kinase)
MPGATTRHGPPHSRRVVRVKRPIKKASAVSRTVLPLPYDVNGAFLARRCVEQFVAERTLDGAAGDLCLIASELVTNAIRHGAEPIELTLHCQDGEVTIEVADGDPRINNVRLRAGDHLDLGGRGLRVVASLADRWGTRPSLSGKTVWATTQTTHA